MIANIRQQRFLVIMVDDKYWKEITDDGGRTSQKGFTGDPLVAYRIPWTTGKTLDEMLATPATDYLRPDFSDWYPELRRAKVAVLSVSTFANVSVPETIPSK